MLAVYASAIDRDDPLSGLNIDDRPDPDVPDGWTTITLRAASLNHHDLWSLRGVGLPEDRLPMILGCDAAGLDEDGNEVIVHSVITDPSWHGDETLDPRRSLLSERYQGTFAERVAVPSWNLLPKPAELSFEEAACLPTAWLTAYRMLFTRGAVPPGSTVLVQGATGGVATALTVLGSAAGIRIWVTGRSEEKRAQSARARRRAGIRTGRAPARARRRGDGDHRPGDLGALDQGAEAGRDDRDLGSDHRRCPAGGADADLLPAAVGRRVDDGDARGARTTDPDVRRQGRAPGDQRDDAADRGPGGIRGDAPWRHVGEDRVHKSISAAYKSMRKFVLDN